MTGAGVDSPTWDEAWRGTRVDNLAVLARQLWQVGIEDIFVDGSFVEATAHPNDIDGYFACDFLRLVSGDLARALNALDPYHVWTWDNRARRATPGKAPQLPMWHQYRVDLYPDFGQFVGRQGSGPLLTAPELFRQTRDGRPKGVNDLQREGAP